MMSAPDSIGSVRRRIKEISENAEHMTIDRKKLSEVAQVAAFNIGARWWEAYRDAPEHYQFSPLHRGDENALMFVLVNSAQMWLIWERMPNGDIEPWNLHIGDELFVGAAAITAAHWRGIRMQNQNLLDPNYLAQMSIHDVERLYRDDCTGQTSLQNLTGRQMKFNEIGQVLNEEFSGQVTELFERAGGFLYREDGTGLVQLLVDYFPRSFADWPFYKLANVVVFSLFGLRNSGVPTTSEFMRLSEFHDLGDLEGGADYYRPFFLMRVGVLQPTPTLRDHLKNKALTERDSTLEQEIRATTLEVLRALTEAIGTYPADLPSVEMETHAQAFLKCRHCRSGIPDEELLCSYKTVCVAYNQDPELMEIWWPLVHTTAY
ncbi:MAG TPA: hypothetical protein DEP84_25930 [Chloroflexi bacterium]|nr:hypothetical protein [Chloroflexota bacterium]